MVTARSQGRATIRLIINADDYGYFPCVSQGIIQAARAGVVGATGILANGPRLAEQVRWLDDCEGLDLGIHLNLTSGRPLTPTLAERLDQGRFSGAFDIAAKVILGRVGVALVRDEWRAQIESVLSLRSGGLPLRFLNSHEHVHMLPQLFPVAAELAREYHLPFVRRVQGEWLRPFGLPALLRNLVIGGMALANPADRGQPLFIGLSRSGRLDLDYLKARLAGLRPGSVYELMCHPGLFDPAQITDPHLLAYHAWEGELTLLCGQAFRDLCETYGIELINYRSLVTTADR
jgi:predicted glycoside hydrolase/deacetylase ChbG (UPF0249 family)